MSKRPTATRGPGEMTAAERKQRARSQWYTRPELARRLWLWGLMRASGVGRRRPMSVLEPTCGVGGLLMPILELGVVTSDVVAIDVDKKNTATVEKRFCKHLPNLTAITGNFLKLTTQQVGRGFDFAPVNFPFENNLHIDMTEHAFAFTERVTGIYPADVSYSEKRGAFWDWHDIVREARLRKRPKFGGRFTPMTNFVVLDLRRRQFRRKDGEASPALIEWW